MKKVVFIFIFLTSIVYAQMKIIPTEEAFNASVTQRDDFLFLDIKMADGVYLLDDNFVFEVVKSKKFNFTNASQKSNSKIYNDKKVYFEHFEAIVPIDILRANGIKGKTTLKFTYQGCANGGITCYPPLSENFVLQVQSVKNINTNSERGKIAFMFFDKSIFFVLISFFGFGLLLSLTPCVFPMIPILSSIIVNNSKDNMSSKKGFLLSFIYVFSASVAYAIVGVIAGIFGANLQSTLQNFWVILLFSILFVLLALSMFGVYSIDISNSLKTKISKLSSGKNGLLGVVIMGFLSALIVGPCVAAPLAGALLYISHSGNAFLGAAALFVMSFGMGVPLLLIGLSAGRFLPKPGVWMNRVMNFFGIVLLFMAVWMLSRAIEESIALIFYGLLIVGISLYFGVFNKNISKLLKIISFIVLIYGALVFIGGVSGAGSLLNPLQNIISQKENKKDDNYLHIKSLKELKDIVAKEQKPIMIKFTASWCSTCKELENKTLSKPNVREKLKEFVLIKIDVTKYNDNDKELLKYFELYGPPGIIFYKDNIELKNFQIVGFKNESEFLKHINEILDDVM
ncbi:MAG: protein-disulfide reductase DsbD [Campylobacteraceae bacterium]|jgi:thiol:disulfide interchange protein DsbD|nr:protein-disulfide reductase DsbD [Campylobacteraceae bacterium]